jgi:transposase-like protein
VDGRKVFRSLVTPKSESAESWVEGLRALMKRGLQTPGTITTDGDSGLSKAGDSLWPRSLRIRGWVHKRQHLMQKVLPPAWPACKALVAARRDAPTFEEGPRR